MILQPERSDGYVLKQILLVKESVEITEVEQQTL